MTTQLRSRAPPQRGGREAACSWQSSSSSRRGLAACSAPPGDARMPQQRRRRPRLKAGGGLLCRCKARSIVDYTATGADGAVLQRPLKDELRPSDVRNVFDYPRNLYEKYELGAELGSGSFGTVRVATDRATGQRFACKQITKAPRKGFCTPRYLLKVLTEVDAMQQLGPSLDAVYLREGALAPSDVFEDNESVHLVMELCEGGGILDRLQKGLFTEACVARIIRSVLRFVAQCHAKGLIFRDVKPENFLFLNSSADSPIRATDFGLSIRYWPEDGRLKSRSGTPVYMAPEVILQSYGGEADVWSAGMLCYHLLTGTFPFWDDVQRITLQQVWQAILTKNVDMSSSKLDGVSDAAKDLLKGLLVRDVDKRMTAEQALDHPWVKKGGLALDNPLAGTVVQRLQRHATHGHLKQLVLRMITNDALNHVDASTLDLVGSLRDQFNTLDLDGSGGISPEELTTGLASQGYTLSEAEAAQLLARVDIDADGTISFDELASALVDWNSLWRDGLWTQWVDVAFDKLDINGDGFISLSELLQRLPAQLASRPGGVARDTPAQDDRLLEARRMLREADTNADGRISREEFHRLFDLRPEDTLGRYDDRWTPTGTERKSANVPCPQG